MEKLLEVKNLSVSFNTYAGEVKAVRNVNFDLYKGETLCLVGESGCGKTVTSKSILRLLKKPFAEIKEGSQILLDGNDVVKMNNKELNKYRGRDVSMIFQDPMTSLNPTMTIGKQIMESLLIHRNMDKKQAREEAINVLKLVNIANADKRVDCYPHELSGGMRQRVMIAIAISCSPKVLIADEPTTALDVTIQAQIFDLLSELKEKLNTAIILVTHDLGVVANFADRIHVMYAGQIIEKGTKKEIFYNSKHPYTWALLNSVPKLDTKSKESLYSLKGTPPDLILPLNHCPFASRCDHCMQICIEQAPPVTQISETQSVACFLQHSDAPVVKDIYGKEVRNGK